VWIEAQVHATSCMLAAGRGQWDDADRHLASARSRADQLGTIEAIFNVCIAQAAIARARDDAHATVEALGGLVGTGESSALPMLTTLWWWPPLIGGLIDTGELDAAAVQIEQLDRAAADRRLDLAMHVAALRARLSHARGDGDRSMVEYEEAIDLMSDEYSLLDRGSLLTTYAKVLMTRGRRTDALAHLRAARALFASVGAEPYLERVDAELRRAGLPSAPASTRAPLDLTDRERDVATLVARGLTNREVAEELYVSTKAVEYHLRNIFRKLGIKSRRELASRL
jgi:ATP/maltotriose-dependent transcriptional regulator MalT